MTIGIANIPYLFAGAVFALGGGVLLAASFGWLAGNEDLLYAGAGGLLLVRALEFWLDGLEVEED